MIGSPLNKGTTLVELLLAIAVFAVVVVMIAGLVSRLVFIERRDTAEQALQADVRFALEIFSRETRLSFASTFALSDNTGQSLVMRNQNGHCVNYRLNQETGALERAEVEASGATCLGANFANTYAPLSNSRIRFAVLRFDLPDSVYNASDNRLDRQGFVTLIVKAHSTNDSVAPLELQTTVTSRQTKVYESQ